MTRTSRWLGLTIIALAAVTVGSAARAEAVNPAAARGKSVLYVANRTTLEAARAVPTTEPKRIEQLETWRRNDLKIVGYLQSLGFKVDQVDEHAPMATTQKEDSIVISESVNALMHLKSALNIASRRSRWSTWRTICSASSKCRG